MSDVVAIIPARGGSKGVPRKNVRAFAGRPLIVHSIEQARCAACVSRTVVSTDDAEIAGAARDAGAEVVVRPAGISGDQAPSEPALLHALDALARGGFRPGVVVFLQATSPVRDSADIDAAVALLRERGADCVVSATPSHDFLWSESGGVASPLNYDPARRPRRQEMPPQFRENGSIYVMRAEGFRKAECRVFGRAAVYPMPAIKSFQIDSPEDFGLVEAMYALHRRRTLAPALRSVRLIVFDFDGVMTDNRVLVMQDGTEGVLCNRSDGLGLERLRAGGPAMLVLSKEQNPVVAARCRKLRIECLQGIDDKAGALSRVLSDRGIAPRDAAYLGNDINDLPCMRLVGVPMAVADAYPPVLAAASYVTRSPGGAGAVREICDLFLDTTDPARSNA